MNRRLLLTATLALVALLAVNVNADVKKGEFLVAPQGGLGAPLGDYPSPQVEDIPAQVHLGEAVQVGFGVSGRISRMLTERMAIGVLFGLNVNKVDESGVIPPALQDSLRGDFQWRTVQIGPAVQWFFQPEKRTNPFVHLGAGLYVNKLETDLIIVRGSGTENRSERSKSSSDLGVSVGPGVLMRVSKDVRLSLEAVFHNVFTEDKSVRFVNFSLGMVIGVTPQ